MRTIPASHRRLITALRTTSAVLAATLLLSSCSDTATDPLPTRKTEALASCPPNLDTFLAELFGEQPIREPTSTRFTTSEGDALPTPSCSYQIGMGQGESATYGYYLTDSGAVYTEITDTLKKHGYALVAGTTVWQKGDDENKAVNLEAKSAEGAQAEGSPIDAAYILVTIYRS